MNIIIIIPFQLICGDICLLQLHFLCQFQLTGFCLFSNKQFNHQLSQLPESFMGNNSQSTLMTVVPGGCPVVSREVKLYNGDYTVVVKLESKKFEQWIRATMSVASCSMSSLWCSHRCHHDEL